MSKILFRKTFTINGKLYAVDLYEGTHGPIDSGDSVIMDDKIGGNDILIVQKSTTSPSPTPPTADNRTIQTNLNTAVQITLIGTDLLPGDVLKFSVVGSPQHGNLANLTANSVTYTPNNGFTGTDNFTYKATDGQGVSSNIATVTITVNPSPTPAKHLIIKDVSASTAMDTPVDITLNADNSEPSAIVSFTLGSPSNGTVVVKVSLDAPSTVTYTPNRAFSGPDGFTYHATDDVGQSSNTANVSISVGSV